MTTVKKSAWAIIAILSAGILSRASLGFSFGTLLVGFAILFALAMLARLWFSERAYRLTERERDEHFIKEREFASARLRERGD
ncbi:MAG TPA: hypothetical protein VHS33_04505 [Sphingomicrobium sp.]|jgi:uncharacterized membrane protein YhiD involved in acid resistance|nr:hypothetical protein [Sphingomicrobium sp.]